LKELVGPTVAALGYELVGVEYVSAGQATVRLYIDREAGISLEDCERVSRQVGAVLDVEDPIAGNYNLEVSSPGLDRPLFEPEHFRRFAGEPVRIRLATLVEGRRKLTGVLRGMEGDQVLVEADGETFRLPLETIAKANLRGQV
jgi:ribosome maturation factor RimP